MWTHSSSVFVFDCSISWIMNDSLNLHTWTPTRVNLTSQKSIKRSLIIVQSESSTNFINFNDDCSARFEFHAQSFSVLFRINIVSNDDGFLIHILRDLFGKSSREVFWVTHKAHSMHILLLPQHLSSVLIISHKLRCSCRRHRHFYMHFDDWVRKSFKVIKQSPGTGFRS